MNSSTLVDFDVDIAVRLILNEAIAITLRALKLYELQLALIMCQRPTLVKRGSKTKRAGPTPRRRNKFVLWVPRPLFDWARACASARLLQHLEDRQDGVPEIEGRLMRMIADNDYVALHDEFSAKGGWLLAIPTNRAKDFQKEIQALCSQARETAKVVGFSVHFRQMREYPRIRGGLTTARNVLEVLAEDPPDEATKRFRPDRSVSTLKSYWTRHSYAPAFLYLAYFERKRHLRPPNVTSRDFAPRLLQTARDHEGLLSCFGRHNSICKHIEARGYSNPRLKIEGLPRDKLAPFDPLPWSIISLCKSKR